VCLSGKWQQLEAGPCQTPDAGQVCGGFTGTQCPTGSFCDYAPTDLCGAFDATGICRGGGVSPCTADCPGVCGCDGKFYCNACVAHNAGTDDSTDRSCLKLDASADVTGKVCGGLAGIQCDAQSFCDFASASDACGGGDAQGICKPRPAGCTADCPGTCGCDGKMYCNACSAQMRGVDESFDRSCLKKDGG
jgi:hypothetical protein